MNGQDMQAPPEIHNIRPAIHGDSLVCSFASPALFSGKIKQTLFSGLPVLIELRSTLVSDSGPGGISPLLKYRLTYDIWEDQFMMETASQKTVFTSFTELEAWWNPRENLTLVAVSAGRKRQFLPDRCLFADYPPYPHAGGKIERLDPESPANRRKRSGL